MDWDTRTGSNSRSRGRRPEPSALPDPLVERSRPRRAVFEAPRPHGRDGRLDESNRAVPDEDTLHGPAAFFDGAPAAFFVGGPAAGRARPWTSSTATVKRIESMPAFPPGTAATSFISS